MVASLLTGAILMTISFVTHGWSGVLALPLTALIMGCVWVAFE